MTHPGGPGGSGPSGDSGTGPKLVAAIRDRLALGIAIARMTGALCADVIRDTREQRRFIKNGGIR